MMNIYIASVSNIYLLLMALMMRDTRPQSAVTTTAPKSVPVLDNETERMDE